MTLLLLGEGRVNVEVTKPNEVQHPYSSVEMLLYPGMKKKEEDDILILAYLAMRNN